MADSSLPTVSSQQKLAIVTLAKEILHQLNIVAALRKSGRKYQDSWQIFKEMCLILEFIPEHLQNTYLELLPVIASEHDSLKPLIVDDSYLRLSTPYKRGMISRITSELIVP